MFYMKRANETTQTPENRTPKAKKSAVAQTVKAEKAATPKKKPVAEAKENVKKSTPKTAAKNSANASKANKTAIVKQTLLPKTKKIVASVSIKPKPSKKQIISATEKKKVKVAEKKAEAEISQAKTKPDKSKVQTVEKEIKAAIQPVKPKSAKKKSELIGEKVETLVLPIAAKPLKKKIKPIGSAVVRGRTGRYDFEMFPLDAELKDGSAIFVISKRITDKRGRGHHKFVCLGQTESLVGEIKKHKKDKCIKQHKANVICLLREEDERSRRKIETDLREAHTLVCNQK